MGQEEFKQFRRNKIQLFSRIKPRNIFPGEWESIYTGEGNAEIYLTPKKLKEIQEVSARHLLHLERNFRQVGIKHVVLDSSSIDDCYQVLSSFFENRKRTRV